MITEAEVVALAATLGEQLERKGWMCATAESCTGGLIGHLITETPGCSAYFAGGGIVYSYPAKERVLGVLNKTLMGEGAVSYAVAQQMAQGARRLYNVELAVAVTGIAGPGGGLPGKPTGTVYIHLSTADGIERGERYVWDADRSGNKLLSAQAALQMMLDYMNSLEEK